MSHFILSDFPKFYHRTADPATGMPESIGMKPRPIPTDKTTQESDCDKFFNDAKLIDYLKQKFAIFDVRK